MRRPFLSCLIAAFLLACAGEAAAQALRNTLTLDNESGQTALVKLVGPTPQSVEVLRGHKRTVRVAGGQYTLLARYGLDPSRYVYTRGEPFLVEETAVRFTAVTVPLRGMPVNSAIHRISKDEFERGTVPAGEAAPYQKYEPLLQISLTREHRWDKPPARSRGTYQVSELGPDPRRPTFVGLTNVEDTWGPLLAPRHSQLIAFVRAARPGRNGELALLVNGRTVWRYTGNPPEVTMRGFGQADLKGEFIRTPVIDLRPHVKPGQGFLLTLRSRNTRQRDGYAIDAFIALGR